MKIEFKKSQNGSKADALVVFATQSKKGKETTVKIGHSELAKKLSASVSDKSITGKAKETVLFREMNFEGFRHVVVVGLGTENDSETLRQSAAAACKTLAGLKIVSAHVDVDAVLGGAASVGFLAEGLVLCGYNFNELKSKKDESKELTVTLVSKKADVAQKKAFEASVALAETVNFSRRLGDMPGNLMTPTILANTVVDAAKGTKVKVTVWDKARIKKEKMGGLLGVSEGSDQEPRFIIMEYKGAAASKKACCLCWKRSDFDSGGISLKPGAGMEEMKYDMCGGANVIGALLAIAKLKLKVNAVALIASTENMPGPRRQNRVMCTPHATEKLLKSTTPMPKDV